MTLHPPQRIFFDGAFRPIEDVAAIMLDGGSTVEKIFRKFELCLGVGQHQDIPYSQDTERTPMLTRHNPPTLHRIQVPIQMNYRRAARDVGVWVGLSAIGWGTVGVLCYALAHHLT